MAGRAHLIQMHFVGEARAGDVGDSWRVEVEEDKCPMVCDHTASLLVNQPQLLLAVPATATCYGIEKYL